MHKHAYRAPALLVALALITLGLMLGGCGGSGGGVSSQVVSGTASVGAPLAGQVTLKDSSTPALQKIAVIGSDGTYAFDVTGMKAPYILQGTGTAGSASYTFHSFAGGTGIANVNPLSNAIVACAAGVAAPEQVFSSPDPATLQKIQAALPAATSSLLTQIQPLLKMYGADGKDPIKDAYKADHQGMDALFDNVTITIPNGTLTIANSTTGSVIFSAPVGAPQKGHFSSDPSALPQPAALPGTPTGVAAAGGSEQATITWSAVGNASSYNIYYATSPGVTTATGTKITSVTPPYIHTGLAAATSYYYIVTAVNSNGESAPSAEVSATTTTNVILPAAPAGVIATGGTKQTSVSWNAVPGAISYNLYYSTSTGVTKSTGTKIANVTSPAVHSGLAAGTTYYYVVTAVNGAGEGPVSVQVAAATLNPAPAPTAPAVPGTVQAVGGANQVTLSWNAVSGASSYTVYYSTAPGVTAANGTKIAGVTSPYVKTGLAAGTTYYFIVTASNSVGESGASSQVSATTNQPVPKQLTLTWDSVSGATGYNLYWSTSPGVTPSTGTKISKVSSPYVHTGLSAGTTYYYVVTATDATSESAPSTQASGTTGQ